MRGQPKKHISRIRLSDKSIGNTRRREHAESIMEDAPVFPKPLDYIDIDNAFFSFVNNSISIVANGLNVPTFKLYSGQRFSEYTQTWEHVDANKNLLMNFKTITREPNPMFGDNQGGFYNIPGDRKYTLLMRSVMEDDGKEVYEVYSMKQPYAVNLTYRVGFLTNEYDLLNLFNSKVNDLFKSRQCYISVNDHYIPLVLDAISDETRYGTEEQKFFTQIVTIKAMAYIIREEDFEVRRMPKDARIGYDTERMRKKPQINIDEFDDDNLQYRQMEVSIELEKWNDKVEFVIDSDMEVDIVETSNIRNYRLWVNKEPIYAERGFSLKENDSVRFKIFFTDPTKSSTLVMKGYNPNVSFNPNFAPEFVSDDVEREESVRVE